MRMNLPAGALLFALILAESGCGNKEDLPPPEAGPPVLRGRIGTYSLEEVPLKLSFAPASPFVRVPLLLAEASAPKGFRMKARLPLRGIRELRQVPGRTWTLEEGLLLTLPGEKEPRPLSELKVRMDLQSPPAGGPRVRCTLEGALFAPSGKEETFHLTLEGPLLILDGRFHGGK